MSNTTFGHSPAELEEKLATYWQLVEERELFQRHVAKAKSEKDSVNERIFRKVMSEYESALESTERRLTPLENEIEELRRTVDAELKASEVRVAELEDEVAEAQFRQRIGEYDESAMSAAVGQLKPRIDEALRQRDQLAAQLEAMNRRRQSTPPTAVAAEPVATTPQSPQPAPDRTTEAVSEDVENPHHWADQIETITIAESPVISGTASTKPDAMNNNDDDDPLRALSDPAPVREHNASSQATRTQAQPVPSRSARPLAPSYPSLVIRSGVHAGKIVPLLPMTMSIGREHDNNIELKDPEVARYHARVLYEDGRFLVEDLESSSGTWVNGVRQRRTALSDGDVIRIGGTELQFEFS